MAQNKDENMKLSILQKSLLQNKSIPSSYIVYNESVKEILDEYRINFCVNDNNDDWNKLKEFKIRCYILYVKYIIDTSELQINVSYTQKEKISQFIIIGQIGD